MQLVCLINLTLIFNPTVLLEFFKFINIPFVYHEDQFWSINLTDFPTTFRIPIFQLIAYRRSIRYLPSFIFIQLNKIGPFILRFKTAELSLSFYILTKNKDYEKGLLMSGINNYFQQGKKIAEGGLQLLPIVVPVIAIYLSRRSQEEIDSEINKNNAQARLCNAQAESLEKKYMVEEKIPTSVVTDSIKRSRSDILPKKTMEDYFDEVNH